MEPDAPLRYAISRDVVDCPLADGLAVFDSRAGTYFSLNRTAALIWNAARVSASRADLHGILASSFSQAATPEDLAGDLDAIVRDFVDAGLFVIVGTERPPAAKSG